MKTMRSSQRRLAVLGLFCALGQCQGQGTFTVTFDGPPIQPRGTARLITNYYESGMVFTPIDPSDLGSAFGRRAGGSSLYPENGTTYLQGLQGSTLKFARLDGSVFGLASVDLAEYSTVFAYPATVHFVGYRADGTTVTTDFTTDGIIDGTGPLADFQTFYFGPEFSGLARVEIPYPGWSLDNLVVSVPEPGTCALLLFGAGFFAAGIIGRRDAPWRWTLAAPEPHHCKWKSPSLRVWQRGRGPSGGTSRP